MYNSTTHVNGLLALLSALTECVDDLADCLEEVGAREGPQLIPLGPLCDREREGGGADGRQPQVPGHVRQQRRRGTQRLLQGEGRAFQSCSSLVDTCVLLSLT